MKNKETEKQPKKDNFTNLDSSFNPGQARMIQIDENIEYINKHCVELEGFIIDDQFTKYDLFKLANLNSISLLIKEGWYQLTIDLVKELSKYGWDKKVSRIEERDMSLRFVIEEDESSILKKIINKYDRKSEYVCVQCGEPGIGRSDDSVLCIFHHFENRNKIKVFKDGFSINGIQYYWKDVQTAYFRSYNTDRNLNYIGNYDLLELVYLNPFKIFKKENNLIIHHNDFGFRNFILNIPTHFKDLDYDYINRFEKVSYCEVCGYEAVSNNNCECCEDIILDKSTCIDKEESIKDSQIEWAYEKGDYYAQQLGYYSKNPDHKIYFSEKELEDYIEYTKQDFLEED